MTMMMTALSALAVVLVVVLVPLTSIGFVVLLMTSILLSLIKKQNKLEKIGEGHSGMGFVIITLMLI